MGFDHSKRHYIFAWLLILALAQRAFIAPGYMPDISTGNDFPLTITMCNGDGTYAGLLARIQDQKGKSGTEHKHTTAVCGLLTGSINLHSNATLFNDALLQPPISQGPAGYSQPAIAKPYPRTHPSRASPVSFAIQLTT